MQIHGVFFALLGLFALVVQAADLATVRAPSRCQRVLMAPVEPSPTDVFIAYVTTLHEQGIVSDTEFSSFCVEAGNSVIINPIPVNKTFFDSSAAVHRAALAEMVVDRQLDIPAISKWALNRVLELQQFQKNKTDVQLETKVPALKMTFAVMSPVEFNAGWNPAKTTLTHKIEVMTTPVTQSMWAEIMGVNPATFAEGPESIAVEIGGEKIRMQLNHPIENITWWSAIVYANELSKRHGLKPVYDLSQIALGNLSVPEAVSKDISNETLFWLAARGRLTNDTRSADFVKINAPNGDIYQAEGYRLPTAAEQYFLRGQVTDSPVDLPDFAWLGENTIDENDNRSTREVAEKIPAILNGSAIFDIKGNVAEWSSDYLYTCSGRVYGNEAGVNPRGMTEESAASFLVNKWDIFLEKGKLPMAIDMPRAVSGAGGGADAFQLNHLTTLQPSHQSSSVGFRLVRTLK